MSNEPQMTDYGQPIETAPRDGSKIQVRSIQSGKWHTAKWNPEGDSWADEFGVACESGFGTIQVTGYWSSEGGWFQPNEVDRWKQLMTDDGSQTTPWRPIETAPRDGTLILLARWDRGEPDIISGHWMNSPDCWCEWGLEEGYQPTHWMQIPEPPKDVR